MGYATLGHGLSTVQSKHTNVADGLRHGVKSPALNQREVLANETIDRLLNCLDGKGQLRSIAIWKWEGHSKA
jgi:hypothetical protein